MEEDQSHRNLTVIASVTTIFLFFPASSFFWSPNAHFVWVCRARRVFYLQLAGRMIYVIPISPAVFRTVFYHIVSFSSELIHIASITSLLDMFLFRHLSKNWTWGNPLVRRHTGRKSYVRDVKFTYSAKENLPLTAPPASIAPMASLRCRSFIPNQDAFFLSSPLNLVKLTCWAPEKKLFRAAC